ncbi:MAG: HAD hydrolase family protein, partial [Phycisphaeraceae bacterium]|nr:HAD hydrolase family protein [Phycisphaeraceae bacterium]
MDFSKIQLLLLDVDGVLTDGSILIDSGGGEMKRFFVRDGSAMVAWQKLGLDLGVITGRPSQVTTHRLGELGVRHVAQCGAMSKPQAYENLCGRLGVQDDQCAYVGDDWADLAVMKRVAYPIAVADGAEQVRQAARYVTSAPGGRGAVREAIEHLLKSMGRY